MFPHDSSTVTTSPQWAHDAVQLGEIKPHPYPGPLPPQWGPALPQMCDCHRSCPALLLRTPPRCEGWWSWRSRQESRCLWGWAEKKRLHLPRALTNMRRRSWRRVKRILQESFGHSQVWWLLSFSGCCSSDFSEDSAAFWPCSSWSPLLLPQSQNAPCSLLESHLHPSCICENRIHKQLIQSLLWVT